MKKLLSIPRMLSTLLMVTLPLSTSLASTEFDLSTLTVTTLDGNMKSIADVKSKKVTYIKFWASWCQPCLEQMPHFQKVEETYGDEVDVIAVNIDLNETSDNIKRVIDHFGLTMPVVKDSQGELKQAFQFAGTPYHVLLNESGKILHTGHDADAALDSKIKLLAKSNGRGISSYEFSQPDGTQFNLESLSKGRKVLFFTSTWCDWYLEESRPYMSRACTKAQRNLASINNQPVTIVSHMWTGSQEVEEFTSKYNISSPVLIDQGGEAFFTFNVRSFPTFIVLENGKEVFRTSDYNDKRLDY